MAQVLRTPRAEADLEEILDDLDRRDPRIARRFAQAIAARWSSLANFPETGRMREEIGPGLRSVLVKPHVVFYRIRGDVVQVLRILHGRRKLALLLTEDEPA